MTDIKKELESAGLSEGQVEALVAQSLNNFGADPALLGFVHAENYDNDHKDLAEDNQKLRDRIFLLESAARNLRTAQKLYMANRGNQEYGKAVAVAAKQLDKVLGDV